MNFTSSRTSEDHRFLDLKDVGDFRYRHVKCVRVARRTFEEARASAGNADHSKLLRLDLYLGSHRGLPFRRRRLVKSRRITSYLLPGDNRPDEGEKS